jgi:hypothetical protein
VQNADSCWHQHRRARCRPKPRCKDRRHGRSIRPTRRTPRRHSTKVRVTPAAVEAFQLCEAISAAGVEESRAEEYREARRRLYVALDLRPWLENPLDVRQADPADWMQDPHRIASWREAWTLRLKLQETVAASRPAQ